MFTESVRFCRMPLSVWCRFLYGDPDHRRLRIHDTAPAHSHEIRFAVHNGPDKERRAGYEYRSEVNFSFAMFSLPGLGPPVSWFVTTWAMCLAV